MKKIDNLAKQYKSRHWGKFKIFIKKHFHKKYILQNKIFFKWQYLLNPYNFYHGYAMKLLIYNNKLLGYMGLVPSPLKIFHRTVKQGIMPCNLMVGESCRGLGLGARLVQSVMKDAKIIWATKYKKETGPMYEKIGGWKQMGDLNRYALVINSVRMSRLINKKIDKIRVEKDLALGSEFFDSDLKIREIRAFSSKIDDFWKVAAPKYPITVVRTKKYLNWRYSRHPFFRYNIIIAEKSGKIKGYAVYRIEKSSGYKKELTIGRIVDLMAAEGAAENLLSYIKNRMIKIKADMVDYFSTGHFHDKELKALGFHRDSDAPYNQLPMLFNPLSFSKNKINFIVYYGKLKRQKGQLGDINNWYITKGDGDQDRPNPH